MLLISPSMLVILRKNVGYRHRFVIVSNVVFLNVAHTPTFLVITPTCLVISPKSLVMTQKRNKHTNNANMKLTTPKDFGSGQNHFGVDPWGRKLDPKNQVGSRRGLWAKTQKHKIAQQQTHKKQATKANMNQTYDVLKKRTKIVDVGKTFNLH